MYKQATELMLNFKDRILIKGGRRYRQVNSPDWK